MTDDSDSAITKFFAGMTLGIVYQPAQIREPGQGLGRIVKTGTKSGALRPSTVPIRPSRKTKPIRPSRLR